MINAVGGTVIVVPIKAAGPTAVKEPNVRNGRNRGELAARAEVASLVGDISSALRRFTDIRTVAVVCGDPKAGCSRVSVTVKYSEQCSA